MAHDTTPIRPEERFDEGVVAAYLRTHLPDRFGAEPIVFEQFPGGKANLTYLARSGETELVLRRPPLGPVAPEAGAVERKLGVGHVLRAVAREGAAVRIRSVGLEVRGRIVRVGADHLDVVPEPPASAGGALVVSIALGGLLVVESS